MQLLSEAYVGAFCETEGTWDCLMKREESCCVEKNKAKDTVELSRYTEEGFWWKKSEIGRGIDVIDRLLIHVITRKHSHEL